MTVEFETDSTSSEVRAQQFIEQKETSSITSWFVKKGWVASEEKAQQILVLIVCLCFAVTLFILYSNFFSQPDASDAIRTNIGQNVIHRLTAGFFEMM
jgi:hypothetical protein